MPDALAVRGLSSQEAAKRLATYGPNSIPEARRNRLLEFFSKFWAPVPWMLEATVALELALGKFDEAIIIAALLLFNSVLSFVQESHSNRALAMLRKQLPVEARVLRDRQWQLIPAENLVPGDAVYLRMGDIVPADIRLTEGDLLLDESALTGESLPVEREPGATAHAGGTVRRGEAAGEVTATGPRTYFGKTAELVGTAKTVSHLQEIVFRIVRYMVLMDGVLVLALLAYAAATGIPFKEIIPFALILLVASVPVALPATFTVATALGSLELAGRGVLITRLSAIEEAAAMDVLCTDKTGTITKNELEVAALKAYGPYDEDDVLRLAALASDEATQDPIDVSILSAARARGLVPGRWRRLQFIPFEPRTKRSEAVFLQHGQKVRAIKGAPQAVAGLTAKPPDLDSDVERLAANGYRVLAVAAGTEGAPGVAGLVALADPLREDSRQVVESLKSMGVRVIMATGDGPATARAIAEQVGIGPRGCPPAILREGDIRTQVQHCDVIAGVLPEDKFRLVRALQQNGHVTGMTGDGVNDAPALKQAEVGIAVASATDVAKAAASLVLTEPGLGEVVAAVESSRRIYQRMLTYTLNKIVKTIQIGIFLSAGVMAAGVFVVTPLLIVLLLFANDFVTMSIATDNVSPSQEPDRWDVRTLVLISAAIAAPILLLSFGVFYAAREWLHLALPQLQTLMFLMLVFTGQGNVYLLRERRHFWQSRPSRWLLLSSVADIVVVGWLASAGILMAAIDTALIAGLLGVVLAFLVLVDFAKIRIFRAAGIGAGRRG
jgi:H+-transporting ATPase